MFQEAGQRVYSFREEMLGRRYQGGIGQNGGEAEGKVLV